MEKIKCLIAPLAGLALASFTPAAFAADQDIETTVTGTEKDGQQTLAATKIEEVKQTTAGRAV